MSLASEMGRAVKQAFILSINASLFLHLLCVYLITLGECLKVYFPSDLEIPETLSE